MFILDQIFLKEFDGLIDKYTELLVGKTNNELREKIKVWAIHKYISKTMPALENHWGASFPEGKEILAELNGEIKKLNEEYRNQIQKNSKNK